MAAGRALDCLASALELAQGGHRPRYLGRPGSRAASPSRIVVRGHCLAADPVRGSYVRRWQLPPMRSSAGPRSGRDSEKSVS